MTEFFLTQHYGGPDSPREIPKMVRKLRDSIKLFVGQKGYFPGLKTIRIYLKVSGNISNFSSDLFTYGRFLKKQSKMDLDIRMGDEIWQAPNMEESVKQFLVDRTYDAFKLVVEKLKKNKMAVVEEEKLFTDLQKVLDDFKQEPIGS